jgi:ATP-dependent DNA helicase RecG
MNRAELENILTDIESDRIELTISSTDFDKFSEAICSFANDMPNSGKPGYLFIGATPEGRASGLVITDELLQRLAAIRSDGNIQPLPVMNVEKIPLGGGEMAVVEVFPSDLPPVRYRGRTCIRVGPRRAQANPAEERILSERRIDRARTWDSRVCREATLDDLALDLFTLTYRLNAVAYDVVEENDRPLDLQLASLRFYDLKADHPTHAGVLLFGKDPLSFFPGAYVQYVQYVGVSQADEIRQERRLVGDLLDILRDLNRLALEIAEERPVQRPDLSEITVFDYPPKGMRELLMNAVIHRNYEESTTPILINHYSDRIEIQNPGSLYGDLTVEHFPGGTAYRNPILAEAAKILGFVNRFGRGISLAEREFLRNGSPPVQFDPGSNFFLATAWRRP